MEAHLVQNLTAAIALGLGCGTGCSASIGIFLTSYVMTHANSMKKAVVAFAWFFIGKMAALLLVCMASSMVGSTVINKSGMIGFINLNKIMQIGFIIAGVLLIVKWIIDYRKQADCSDCKSNCKSEKLKSDKLMKLPPVWIGFIYGLTPCSPLGVLAGYSAVMSLSSSVVIATAFSVASSISPLIFMVLIAGVLSKKMYDEIPKYTNIIKLSCYILFVAMAFIML